PEKIKMSAERVEIEGDLQVKNGKVYINDGVITDSMIAGDAKIDFAKIANVEITNADIKGFLNANKIIVGGGAVGENYVIDGEEEKTKTDIFNLLYVTDLELSEINIGDVFTLSFTATIDEEIVIGV